MTTAEKSPVSSPCISVCALDDNDICIGCHRSAEEITHWSVMDDEERRAVIRRANERGKANNPWS